MAGQLIPKGDRRWLVRVFVGRDEAGKRRYRSEVVHGTKKQARDRLAELVAEARAGALPLVRPAETVDQYLDTWLETTAKPSVRARTLHDYTSILRRYVRPHLGKLPLEKLTPAHVRAMLVKLREQGLSARTVRMAHEVLRNALEQAVADRLLRDNPARSRLVKKALPAKEKKEPRTITGAEVSRFMEACREDRLGALWCVLLFGGLRPSEALALRWQDLNGDTLTITRVLVDKAGVPLHYAPPKSKQSRRAVVLPAVALDMLKAHRKRQAAERLAAGAAWADNEGLMFTTPKGEPLRQDQVRPALARMLKAAGLPPLSPYALRHSNATLLLEAGTPLKVVSERLGHSTITLTADVYSHVTRGMQEAAAARLDALTNRNAK